jgi:ribose transport system ATP-binding protein
MKPTENVLEIRDLVKDFPGVRAVNNVSFDIKRNTSSLPGRRERRGEIHADQDPDRRLRAHKRPDPAERRRVQPAQYPGCEAKRISTLFQELNVVDQLTVEENLTLGMEDTTFGFLRKTDKINRMISVMNSIEPSIKPTAAGLEPERGEEADRGDRQGSRCRVRHHHHGRADSRDLRIRDRAIVHHHQSLREKNVTVIYISHRLDEIFELGDYVTVMRDGKHIETKPVAEIQDRSELIKMMIGKTVFEQYTPRESIAGYHPGGQAPLQP